MTTDAPQLSKADIQAVTCAIKHLPGQGWRAVHCASADNIVVLMSDEPELDFMPRFSVSRVGEAWDVWMFLVDGSDHEDIGQFPEPRSMCEAMAVQLRQVVARFGLRFDHDPHAVTPRHKRPLWGAVEGVGSKGDVGGL